MPNKRFLLILAIWSIFSACTQPGPADLHWPWSKPEPTPTPTKTPAPLIVVLPIPTLPPAMNGMKALNSTAVRPAELASVRFINTDTLTYLQWGNLYTYELSTNAKRLIVDGHAITSIDWSEKRQQFVFIKAKRLFLFNLANNALLDLSNALAKLSGRFTVPACDLSIASNENRSQRVNLLENVDGVQWTPDQSALIFRTSNFDKDYPCYSRAWAWTVETNALIEGKKVMKGGAQPQWLNTEIFIMAKYNGGGNYTYDILNRLDGEPRLSINTEASTVIGSASGDRVANVNSANYLRVWDVVQRTEIFDWASPKRIELTSETWSPSERYLAVAAAEKLPEQETQVGPFPRLLIIDLAARQQWEAPAHFTQSYFTTWRPHMDELLVFDGRMEGTSIFGVQPAQRSLATLGQIPNVKLYPQIWDPTGRDLLLTGISTTKAGNSWWLWDSQKTGLPIPIYQVNAVNGEAAFDNFHWSPQSEWVLFIQEIGDPPSIYTYGNVVTLQAFHVSTRKMQEITQWVAPPVIP